MGRVKESYEELKEKAEKEKRDIVVNSLCIQYPFISYFIQEAFSRNEESLVYDLIFALKPECETC